MSFLLKYHVTVVQTVEDYIYKIKDKKIQDIVILLHDCLLDIEGVKASINWGLPFYQRNYPIAYINVRKKGGVELCFWKGRELSANHSIVEMKGRKLIGGIVFTEINEHQIEEMTFVLNDAITLDEQPLKLKV